MAAATPAPIPVNRTAAQNMSAPGLLSVGGMLESAWPILAFAAQEILAELPDEDARGLLAVDVARRRHRTSGVLADRETPANVAAFGLHTLLYLAQLEGCRTAHIPVVGVLRLERIRPGGEADLSSRVLPDHLMNDDQCLGGILLEMNAACLVNRRIEVEAAARRQACERGAEPHEHVSQREPSLAMRINRFAVRTHPGILPVASAGLSL